jgi:hypothetical protein
MQLNQTQPSPRTVLLQLNFCYQVQITAVSPGAHPSSYNSVATTLYSTLVYTFISVIILLTLDFCKIKICLSVDMAETMKNVDWNVFTEKHSLKKNIVINILCFD